MLHQLLITCCLEIVLFSYNSQRTFPWILEVFPIQPFYFYKVIEVLIRAEDLSRDVVKHLNHMEEQILESMAWRYQSPLWDYLKNSDQPIPSCEEVSLPSQIYPAGTSNLTAPSPANSKPSDESIQKSTPQHPAPPFSPSTYLTAKRAESSLAASLIQSPVSTGRPLSERTPVQSRRRLFPGAETTPAALPVKEPEPQQVIEPPPPQPSPCIDGKLVVDNKPKRTGSLGLFFRKVNSTFLDFLEIEMYNLI